MHVLRDFGRSHSLRTQPSPQGRPSLVYARRSMSSASPLPLWVWIEYKIIPRYIRLNLLAMEAHAKGAFEINLLNRSTLSRHLSLPAEFERIPYAVAASDFARIGLLANRGGLYMDADILVARPLTIVRDLLAKYEVISYSDARMSEEEESAQSAGCMRGFSPNFVAARPNSTLWRQGWNSLLSQLKRRCGGATRHKICCVSASP